MICKLPTHCEKYPRDELTDLSATATDLCTIGLARGCSRCMCTPRSLVPYAFIFYYCILLLLYLYLLIHLRTPAQLWRLRCKAQVVIFTVSIY